MKTLIAVKEVHYDGKTRHVGDQFEASDLDAVILTAADISGGPRARIADAPQAKAVEPPKPVEKEKMLPTIEHVETPVPDQAMTTEQSFPLVDPPRRRYKRRDE